MKSDKIADKDELTIVVPAYNEEAGIEETVLEIKKYNPKSTILVVNDCSKDKTGEILLRLKKDEPNLQVITQEKNKGYGGALATGFLSTKTKYVAFLDADITYHPKYIPDLLKLLQEKELDCTWGNRFGGKNKMPLLRKVGNKLLVSLFFVLTGKYLPDITSGMRVFKKESLLKLDVPTLPAGLDMITAMSKRIVRRKLKYRIIPIDYEMRSGQSKLNVVTDFLRMARNVAFEK